MSYVEIDGCACPEQLAPYLLDIKRRTGCAYNSIYRGEDAAAILHANGKHTQAELWNSLGPGVANPPGRSTHELRSDGVAYAGPISRVLPWWCCGIDVNDSEVMGFITAAKAQGWVVTQTYPGSRVEYHHVNFRTQPGPVFRTLRLGDRGIRVYLLTRRLRRLGYLHHNFARYTERVRAAVKHFQEDHPHLIADGIYGSQTAAQLDVAYRNR